MGAAFKLLARLLVDVGRAEDRVLLNPGRERDGPGYLSARLCLVRIGSSSEEGVDDGGVAILSCVEEV